MSPTVGALCGPGRLSTILPGIPDCAQLNARSQGRSLAFLADRASFSWLWRSRGRLGAWLSSIAGGDPSIAARCPSAIASSLRRIDSPADKEDSVFDV